MRWGTFAAAAALLMWAGCAAPGSGRLAATERHWQTVCERMRCASTDDETPTAASVSPAAHEVAALRRSAARAAASVVRISTRIEQARASTDAPGPLRTASRPSGGTGVIIDASGLILTCAHVVDRANDIRVYLPAAAEGTSLAAVCVVKDVERDLAIIRIDMHGLTGIELPSAAPHEATPVVAIGAVRDARDARHGRITSTSASLQGALGRSGGPDYTALIETTAALEPGFSGGPLLDPDGRLVGINVAMRTTSGGASHGYAVALDADNCDAIRRMCAASRLP